MTCFAGQKSISVTASQKRLGILQTRLDLYPYHKQTYYSRLTLSE